MAANYQIWITDPFGTRLAVVPDFISVEYTRTVNAVGTLTMTLPTGYARFVVPENRVEVWRSVSGGPLYLDLETAWFIRRPGVSLQDDGQLVLTLTAFDGNHLLKRRVVPYYAGSSQAAKTAAADDMMKTIVSENVASTASDYAGSTSRGLSSTLFTIQANLTAGPSITKTFPWRNVLTVLQEIADASATAGTYLAFDTVYNGAGQYEFRTYTVQRGVDHRFPGGQSPIIFDPQLGNLGNNELIYDYTEELNFIYAGGQGEGSNRVVQSASDSTRMGLSPFNRIEDFQDSRNSDATASILAEAQALVRAGRPKTIFNGAIIETATTRYGKEYSLGDMVTAQFQSFAVDCRIDAVKVNVSEKKETIEVKLQSVA